MPPYGRRRSIKIVVPATPSREKELVGGLKNALERGETLEKAKQSFANAGYKTDEIRAAAQKTSMTATPIKKQPSPPTQTSPNPQATTTPTIPPTKPTSSPTIPTATTPGQPKKFSKTLIIIVVASSLVFLIGAAVLGIFWDKIF